jgi:hypothetical protein
VPAVIESESLDTPITSLRAYSYRTVGPVVYDGAIAPKELSCAAELRAGWVDRQEPGRYRPRAGWFAQPL